MGEKERRGAWPKFGCYRKMRFTKIETRRQRVELALDGEVTLMKTPLLSITGPALGHYK